MEERYLKGGVNGLHKIMEYATLIKDYVAYSAKWKKEQYQKPSNRETIVPQEGYIQIAVKPTGGLGDYIISASFIDRLFTYGPCKIDVYCEKMAFGKAVYGQRPCMRVLPVSMYDSSAYQYDLSMEVEHFVHIQYYNAKRLYRLSPKLFRIAEGIRLHWDELYLDISRQCYRERIHFQQMEMKGLNRYTELCMGNCFRVTDQWSGIFLRSEAYGEFASLQLKEKAYITCNYGADDMGQEKMQLKVWPKPYFESLFRMIHNAYPQIQIVQIGSMECEKLEGADMHILGRNLEVVKWILKRSLLHIDCEGGLVHMATQLGTKCEVIFGPTLPAIYGYPQNRNLVSPICHGCMGIYEKWAFRCYREKDRPDCIYSIVPQMVLDDIMQYLSEKKEFPDRRYRWDGQGKDDFPGVAAQEWEALAQEGPKGLLLFDGSAAEFYNEALRAVSRTQAKRIAIINPGRSLLPFILKKRGADVITFDPDYGYGGHIRRLGRLMEYGTDCGIDMRLASDLSIPCGEESVDFVILFSRIREHESEAVKEANRILKDGGFYLMDSMYGIGSEAESE